MLRLGWIQLSTYGLIVTADNKVMGRSVVGDLPLQPHRLFPPLQSEMPILPEMDPPTESTGEWSAALSQAKIALADTQPITDVTDSQPNADVADTQPITDVADSQPIADVVDTQPIADVADSQPITDVADQPEDDDWDKLLAAYKAEAVAAVASQNETAVDWALPFPTSRFHQNEELHCIEDAAQPEGHRDGERDSTQPADEWTRRMASQVAQHVVAANDDIPEDVGIALPSILTFSPEAPIAGVQLKKQRAMREIRRLEQKRRGDLSQTRTPRLPRDFDTPPLSVLS